MSLRQLLTIDIGLASLIIFACVRWMSDIASVKSELTFSVVVLQYVLAHRSWTYPLWLGWVGLVSTGMTSAGLIISSVTLLVCGLTMLITIARRYRKRSFAVNSQP